MARQLFQYDEDIGYTFIPGLKTRVEHEGGGYLIKVNQAGFRSSKEFIPDKPAGTFRILLFGDSFTAADGVSNKDRYGDILETLVPGLEVYNFGLSGTGTDQQFLIFRRFATTIEYDLVLISVLVENIRRIAARYRIYSTPEGEDRVFAKPYFTLDHGGSLIRHHNPVPKSPVSEQDLSPEALQYLDRGGRLPLLRQAVNKLGSGAKELMQKITRYQPVPAFDSPDSPDWQLMRGILSQWVREVRSPVIICPLPLLQHIEKTASAEKYQSRFSELAQETGAQIHDPLGDYWALSSEQRCGLRFAKDIHPTPAAHRVLAQSLVPPISALMKKVGS